MLLGRYEHKYEAKFQIRQYFAGNVYNDVTDRCVELEYEGYVTPAA